MIAIFYNVITQSLPFLPLALAIYISFNFMKAADMTLDGSFVAGAGVFAKCITLGISPALATLLAMLAGVCTGTLVACIQYRQRIDALLAGILATFMLLSGNLILMGRPNINLLGHHTLLSSAFETSDTQGYFFVSLLIIGICGLTLFFLKSPLGLRLRAMGDNPHLFSRYGFNTEGYRCFGFALTNCLAASAGCITAQTIGYADISMSVGMTLTGLGAIIAGQQLTIRIFRRQYLRVSLEFSACLMGVLIYFFIMNILLQMGVDPLYLKILLGLILIFFLRTASMGGKLC